MIIQPGNMAPQKANDTQSSSVAKLVPATQKLDSRQPGFRTIGAYAGTVFAIHFLALRPWEGVGKAKTFATEE